MMKTVWLIFLSYFLGLTGAFQQSFELINLHDSTPSLFSFENVPIAVSVSYEDLNEVSSSILMAENWLKNHVLTYYPATKITTIVVGQNVFGNSNEEEKWVMILPSVKNLYHSLTRWGLEKIIKISPFLDTDCLDRLGQNVVKPLLNFLKSVNSTYCLDLNPRDLSVFDDADDDIVKFVNAHFENMKKIESFEFNKVNLIAKTTNERKIMSRKLSFMDSKLVEPYPARPTPLPPISPLHSSVGYSVPANVAKKPLPPTLSIPFAPELSPPYTNPSNPPIDFTLPPPALSIPFAPELSPTYTNPANPPFGFTLPPCNPSYTGGRGGGPVAAPESAPPKKGEEEELWCVAKPSVPSETLQEAMDYACGAGGADCEEIKPHGSCYFPDSIVAHASFAFNSYWQKKKKIGGSCSFGGTAMIIGSDPSFLHCRFVLE